VAHGPPPMGSHAARGGRDAQAAAASRIRSPAIRAVAMFREAGPASRSASAPVTSRSFAHWRDGWGTGNPQGPEGSPIRREAAGSQPCPDRPGATPGSEILPPGLPRVPESCRPGFLALPLLPRLPALVVAPGEVHAIEGQHVEVLARVQGASEPPGKETAPICEVLQCARARIAEGYTRGTQDDREHRTCHLCHAVRTAGRGRPSGLLQAEARRCSCRRSLSRSLQKRTRAKPYARILHLRYRRKPRSTQVGAPHAMQSISGAAAYR